MNSLNKHITQLKELLQTIEEYLQVYTDDALLAEKLLQLKNIEQTIRNLQKNNTSIPNELRELKLKLVGESDNWQEAKAAKSEILALLEAFVHAHSNSKALKEDAKTEKRIIKKPRIKKFNEQVELSDLLAAGLIKSGIQLFRTYKSNNYKAVIHPNGQIETEINGTKELFSSPSAAAVAVSTKSQNGWIWWYTDFEGTKRELDYYRKKYLQQNNSKD